MNAKWISSCTMTTLTIKDVPESLAEQLRQRAARNHRSLQGELMSIIEQATLQPATTLSFGPPTGSVVVGMSPQGPVVRHGWKTVEQISAELRAKYPAPIHDQVSSIDLIREDRDSR
jgi:hypothetical protein